MEERGTKLHVEEKATCKRKKEDEQPRKKKQS